jgi:REP element-mobilizing transposase RayT
MVHSSNIPRGWYSRGYLPHFDGGPIPQALTFRLADSFPKERLDAWNEELIRLPAKEALAERRKRIEAYLDTGAGNAWLVDRRIATLVQESLLFFDSERYCLHSWVIMPNHVHVLFTPINSHSLADILHSWKSYTTHRANRMLNRQGKFWQEESFDRYIRNEQHFLAAIDYIESNPVKASLCLRNENWEFSSAARRVAGGTPALPGR